MKDHSKTRKMDYKPILDKLLQGEIVDQDFLKDWYFKQKGEDATLQSFASCIIGVIGSLGTEYPIFEPVKGSYKILTEEDFKIYG